MKTIILLLLAVPVMACNKGCYEIERGLCACDITPEIGPSVKPSDEKPRHNGIPAWQSGEVIASTQPNLSDVDRRADLERTNANAEGKAAAGIR